MFAYRVRGTRREYWLAGVLIVLFLALPASALADVNQTIIVDAASCTSALPGAIWLGTSQCDIPSGVAVTVGNEVVVPSGISLTNEGALTIPDGASIRNVGTITNSGSIVAYGGLGNEAIVSAATISNTGSIDVFGGFGNDCTWTPARAGDPEPVCVIQNGGGITIEPGAHLASSCSSASCAINNANTIDNHGRVDIRCGVNGCGSTLSNFGYMHNATVGVINLSDGGALENRTGANFDNDGSIYAIEAADSTRNHQEFSNTGTFTNRNYISISAPATGFSLNLFFNYGTVEGSGPFTVTNFYSECGSTLAIAVTGTPIVVSCNTTDATSTSISPASAVISPTSQDGVAFTITVTDTTLLSGTPPGGVVNLSDFGAGGTFGDDAGDGATRCTPVAQNNGYLGLIPVSDTTSECRVLWFPPPFGPRPARIFIGAAYQGDATHAASGGAFSTITVQQSPPAVTASATSNGAPYTSGTWTNHDVVVHFDCTAVAGVASVTSDQTLAGDGADQSSTGTCSDLLGTTATATFSGIDIDKTPPSIAYSGNAGTYTVDQQVAITCSASDGLSGLASSACHGANGPAYTFPLGTTTLSATATDNAGNVQTASSSFSVIVTPQSLGSLGASFVKGSAAYRALTAKRQAVVANLLDTFTRAAARLVPGLKPGQKNGFVHAYDAAVALLARGGWLTQTQAATLERLVGAL